MNSIVHKISASVLLFASIIPFAMVFSFHIKQQILHYEMKERLEAQNLHTIILSKKDVHWVKKDKEILVNGRMFDVKSFSVENSEIRFIGLYDDEETALAEQLNNNFNKTNQTGTWLISNLFQWLQSVYTTDNNGTLITESKCQEFSQFIKCRLTSPHKIILTPPPQNT